MTSLLGKAFGVQGLGGLWGLVSPLIGFYGLTGVLECSVTFRIHALGCDGLSFGKFIAMVPILMVLDLLTIHTQRFYSSTWNTS